MNKDGIIDLHTHTFFSDGVLSPAELVQRAVSAGYSAIALTDHVDASNLEHVLSCITQFCKKTREFVEITLLAGVEITHVPPRQIENIVTFARLHGADIVVLHGETICEPVPEGTNLAGIKAGIDILAHPGLISETEVRIAAERGVHLEISARKAHGLGNGRVYQLAKKYNAKCVLDTDTHGPGDLFTPEYRKKVAMGAGMTEEEYESVKNNMRSIVREITEKTYNI
ncbi:MAG: histidinol phosphate phosphatase domain-containing protein [Spirochaetales bacterium]|nr:histidinol phosphate phosphatase domain-containing protein [Spirochaetales bacterium]